MLGGMLPEAPIQAFAKFGQHMRSSWDIDPVYPVLRQLIADTSLTEREADWLTVLYLAYYELASATTAFLKYREPTPDICHDLATLKLPTGIERRGLRDPSCMALHLESWLSLYDGQSFFTAAKETFIPAPRWEQEHYNDGILDAYFRAVAYNGRWAAYKGCEVMHKVRGYPNRAATAGHENSTGPRQGLALFFPTVHGNQPNAIQQLDRQTEVLMAWAEQFNCPLHVDECETLLCDFRSLTLGRYYVGHDIDLMLEGIIKAPEGTRAVLLHARGALPHQYCGELHGWRGRDREAMHAYAERGAILYRSALNLGEWMDAAA